MATPESHATRVGPGRFSDANHSRIDGGGLTNTDSLEDVKSSELPEASQLLYAPQFSAATSLILSRMKASQDFGSALSAISATVGRPDQEVYEEAKSRVVQSMNTSISMPIPASEGSRRRRQKRDGSSSHTPSSEDAGKSNKRKLQAYQEAVDFTQNTIAFSSPPPMAQSTTTLPSHVKDHHQRAGGPSGFGFDGAASRHDGAELPPSHIKIEPGSPSQRLSDNQQANDQQRLQKIEQTRQKRLAALPDGIKPAKPELVGFGAGQASDAALTNYFYDLKKTDALNLLSFCDQLKPQLLVDIMVSVSKKHPDLPMFNSPDWNQESPRAARSKVHKRVSMLNSVSGRSRHGPSLLNSKAKQRIKPMGRPGPKKPHKPSRLAAPALQAAAFGADNVEELPPAWPKAEDGLYARLVPEVEDRSFLADENDEEAFSQFMVDRYGKQVVAPV